MCKHKIDYPKLLGVITLFKVELVGEELALNEFDTFTGILDIRLLKSLDYLIKEK